MLQELFPHPAPLQEQLRMNTLFMLVCLTFQLYHNLLLKTLTWGYICNGACRFSAHKPLYRCNIVIGHIQGKCCQLILFDFSDSNIDGWQYNGRREFCPWSCPQEPTPYWICGQALACSYLHTITACIGVSYSIDAPPIKCFPFIRITSSYDTKCVCINLSKWYSIWILFNG